MSLLFLTLKQILKSSVNTSDLTIRVMSTQHSSSQEFPFRYSYVGPHPLLTRALVLMRVKERRTQTDTCQSSQNHLWGDCWCSRCLKSTHTHTHTHTHKHNFRNGSVEPLLRPCSAPRTAHHHAPSSAWNFKVDLSRTELWAQRVAIYFSLRRPVERLVCCCFSTRLSCTPNHHCSQPPPPNLNVSGRRARNSDLNTTREGRCLDEIQQHLWKEWERAL